MLATRSQLVWIARSGEAAVLGVVSVSDWDYIGDTECIVYMSMKDFADSFTRVAGDWNKLAKDRAHEISINEVEFTWDGRSIGQPAYINLLGEAVWKVQDA